MIRQLVDLLLAVLLILGIVWFLTPAPDVTIPVPVPRPAPLPLPKPPLPIRPCPGPGPWGPQDSASVEAKVGGRTGPDGTELHVDLPGDLHQENIASRGLGCCVFRSADHAARWQNIPVFQKFPEWMKQKGIEGGGYPSKFDKLAKRIAEDRGLPLPEYLQVEGKDLEILKAACQSGRMPCVTYSFSPTGRYGGSRIAHMVNIVHADDNWIVVLDNNYVGDRAYEWLTPQEFLRTYAAGGSGWSIIMLSPPPPPPPVN